MNLKEAVNSIRILAQLNYIPWLWIEVFTETFFFFFFAVSCIEINALEDHYFQEYFYNREHPIAKSDYFYRGEVYSSRFLTVWGLLIEMTSH